MANSKCRSCNLKCDERTSLVCEICDRFIHYKCSELPIYFIAHLELNENAQYYCKLCVTKNDDYQEMTDTVVESIKNTPTTRETSKSSQNSEGSPPATPRSVTERESSIIEQRLEKIDKLQTVNPKQKSEAVCHFYRHNKCQHGRRGTKCARTGKRANITIRHYVNTA